jgi:Domain of unknown function (DUF4388)
MRGLAGDFSTMPLRDVVLYLGNTRASGDLNLERDQLRKQIHIQNGLVVNASSNQPREYLGQILINLGHISEDQFNKAFETQKETKVFLGKILTMIGLVSEEVVLDALNLKVRETLLEALHWDRGTFSFDPFIAPDSLDGLEVQVDLLDLHREGAFREAAWQTIRAVFPHGGVRLELVEKKLPVAPNPNSLEARMISLIREGATIEEMILALHATDFFLYQRLYALHRLEALKVHIEPPKATTPSVAFQSEHTGPQLVRQARMWLDMGNVRDAEAMARRAQDLFQTQETSDLLRLTEGALLAKLRRDLSEGRQVPSLLIHSSKLKTLDLSAPEKYLLSRIDGKRELSGIVRVSPLQELEALKFFQRFIEQGLVKLDKKSGR